MTSPILTFYLLVITFLIYLIQDGRTIMLSAMAPFLDKKYRIQIFNDILPSWDANQTWLVFTIAGIYGAFPTIFGELMSQHYAFFFMMLMFFIIRGASIEFYIKSSRFKSFWLCSLCAASCLLLCTQIYICSILLMMNIWKCIGLSLLMFVFHWTQAKDFLYPNRLMNGLIIYFSALFLLRIFQVNLSIGQTICIGLPVMFFVYSPIQYLRRILLSMFFLSEAFLILHNQTITISLKTIAHQSSPSAFFIINLFSIMLLPLIAIGLTVMKSVFLKNQDEMIY